MQSLLARLYVDEYFRKLLLHQPNMAFEGYVLTKQEQEAVVSIDADRLKYYADGIAKKREIRLSRHFPLLTAIGRLAGREESNRLFRRFHGLHPSVAEVDSQIEVQLFSAFATRHVAGIKEYPAFASDIVRYEFARYKTARLNTSQRSHSHGGMRASYTREEIRPGSTFGITSNTRVQAFDWNVVRVAAQLNKGTLPREVKEDSTTVVLRKKNNRLMELVVTGPTSEILHALDGQTAVETVVDRVEEAFGVPGLYDDVVGVMKQLQEKEIVERVSD